MSINFIHVGSSGRLGKPWNSVDENTIKYILDIDPNEERRRKNNDNTFIYTCAVNDKEGVFPFYLCSKINNSSLYEPDMNVIKDEDKKRFIVKEVKDIKCRKLENIVSDLNIDFDFIKIDTQGADLPIIMGMGKHLKNVVAVHLEAYFIKMYKNMPLIEDIDSFMKDNNFTKICSLRKKQNPIFDDFLYINLDKEEDKVTLIKEIYGL